MSPYQYPRIQLPTDGCPSCSIKKQLPPFDGTSLHRSQYATEVWWAVCTLEYSSGSMDRRRAFSGSRQGSLHDCQQIEIPIFSTGANAPLPSLEQRQRKAGTHIAIALGGQPHSVSAAADDATSARLTSNLSAASCSLSSPLLSSIRAAAAAAAGLICRDSRDLSHCLPLPPPAATCATWRPDDGHAGDKACRRCLPSDDGCVAR